MCRCPVRPVSNVRVLKGGCDSGLLNAPTKAIRFSQNPPRRAAPAGGSSAKGPSKRRSSASMEGGSFNCPGGSQEAREGGGVVDISGRGWPWHWFIIWSQFRGNGEQGGPILSGSDRNVVTVFPFSGRMTPRGERAEDRWGAMKLTATTKSVACRTANRSANLIQGGCLGQWS